MDSTGNKRNAERCEQIIQVCRKASDMVANMMNLAETGDSPTKKVDFNEEVKKGVALLRNTLPEKIQFETVFSADMSWILGIRPRSAR